MSSWYFAVSGVTHLARLNHSPVSVATCLQLHRVEHLPLVHDGIQRRLQAAICTAGHRDMGRELASLKLLLLLAGLSLACTGNLYGQT